MKRETHDFFGWDNTTAPVKLQKGGYWNRYVKQQNCVVVGCKNFGDHVRISDKGYANLVYCHAHAEGYLMAELARNEKPRGHWISVWKGKLVQMYEEKYMAQELISKIIDNKKYKDRYKEFAKYLKI